jgi:hypothetical protein
MTNVKESRNRPGVAQRVPGGLGSQIPWHSARKDGEVVSLTPLPPGMFLVLIFNRGWVDPRTMVRSEGDTSLKNPVTPPGLDPGTVRLVAQRLKHNTTPGSRLTLIYSCKVICKTTEVKMALTRKLWKVMWVIKVFWKRFLQGFFEK